MWTVILESDYADAQADLSVCWVLCFYFVGLTLSTAAESFTAYASNLTHDLVCAWE